MDGVHIQNVIGTTEDLPAFLVTQIKLKHILDNYQLDSSTASKVNSYGSSSDMSDIYKIHDGYIRTLPV